MTKHFISYSSTDALDFALRLRDELEGREPPTPVWLDRRDIQPGEDWDEAIAEALKTCRSLLFVMTPDSVEDESVCKREWMHALRYKKPVIPLKLHPDAEMPFRLAPRQHIDFTRALESDEQFDAALARLRLHLTWLASPAGVLQGLRDRLADAQRDLRRAKDGPQRTRVQDDIDQLRKDIARQEEIVRDPQAAVRRVEESIARGLEHERQPERPAAGAPRSKSISPPPGLERLGIVAEATREEASRIFLCYRRDDSAGHAGRLYDRLSHHFAEERIFMDIDAIEPGEDFVKVIDDAVSSCSILIALIGRRWLHDVDAAGGRRIDNPEDFVRLELGTALKRGIRVIPVLVQGAVMPSSRELPEDLTRLARLNALELSDTRWKYDIERLIKILQKIIQLGDGG